MEYISKCECGRCSAKIVLSQSLENYEARACQCEFCLPRNAVYLSDPLGNLTLSPTSSLMVITQGSGIARFWVCKHCDALLAVTYKPDTTTKGAFNASLLLAKDKSRIKITPASPHLLPAEAKVARWRSLWMDTIFDSKT